jgi:hypothetical protein
MISKTGDGIEGAEVPLGIVVDHVGEVAVSESGHGGLAALLTGDPGRPAVGVELAAGGKNGRDGGVADLMLRENRAERFDLRGGEAVLRVT